MTTKTRIASLAGTLLLLTLTLSCTKEDETARIHGYVRNAAGAGLGEVTVTVGSATAFTNASGYYEIDGLEEGTTPVTFSKEGYIERQASASLTSRIAREVNAQLDVPGWLGTWFSGTFGANFSATGPSLGTPDLNTDFDYNGTEFLTPNRSDGIIDLGPVADLGSIDRVPESGYRPSVTAFAGNAYAVRTTEGNYVKLRVTSLDAGDQAVYFDWYYQANGGRQF